MVSVLHADGTIQQVKSDSDQRFMLVVDEVGDIIRGNKNALTWLAQKPSQLATKNIADILAPQSQFLITEIIVNANSGLRMKEQPIFVYGAARLVKGFKFQAEPVEQDDTYAKPEYRLMFKFDAELTKACGNMDSAKGFADSVTNMVMSSEKELDMTLVSVGDLKKLEEELGVSGHEIEKVTREIEDTLRKSSLDEAALGRVSDGKYGVVHEVDAELTSMHVGLDRIKQKTDPNGVSMKIATKTINLDKEGLEDQELADAMSHAIDSFARSGLDDLIFDNLSSAHTSFINHKTDRLGLLIEALDKDLLSVVYQPVVHLNSWHTDHLWAEFRADLETDGLSVEEIIKFTRDDIEIRSRVDLAQVKFIETDDWHKGCAIAISLHVRSLLQRDVLSRLLKFAQTSDPKNIVLRISGFEHDQIDKLSALLSLQKAGFAVALYGEELGVINPDLLKSLPADFIILEESFTESLARLQVSMPMLGKMETRCHMYGIKLVFSSVSDEDTAVTLSQLTHAVATGIYLGTPVDELSSLRFPIKV